MPHILGIPYINTGTQYTLVGSSFFASWGQTSPYLYNKISTRFKKSLIGYTSDGDNNGKTAHDRLRKLFNVHSGIAHPMSTFIYWSINDMFYCQSSSLPDKEDLAVLKVKNSHFTALANCFSKSFNYFVDEVDSTGTSSFTDTSQTYGSKSFTASKNILVLDDLDSSVTFESTGITNITYFISDEVNLDLGTFDIYVDGQLYKSINTNRQLIYYPNSYNSSVPTIGDAHASPNSVILELTNESHTIMIVNTSNLPVWLDFHSEIETNPDNGAKGVYSFTIPKMREDRLVGSTGVWTANRQHCVRINNAMEEVYQYWRETLGAPVAIADAYNGFDPINDMNNWECTHFSQSGSDFVINRLEKAIIEAGNGKLIIL